VGVVEDQAETPEGATQVSPSTKPATSRVKISKIFENTPAATSGLKSGDVVLRIGNRNITKPTDVIDASFFAEVGEQIPVEVERDGKLLTYKFVVGERPSSMPSVVRIPKIDETSPQILPPVAPSDPEQSKAPDAVNVSAPQH
jgi:S1-C subfamily serine protease